ncbi:MAG: DUF3450 family protein [Myxococcales bacterium]|nr:DUF3450 family protein [Myxococcales bacterium]
MRRGLTASLTLLVCAALPLAAARAERGVSSLATSLARMRSEVEALSAKVESKKNEQRARLRSLSAQKAELEIQIKREQLRLRQLAKRRAAHEARVKARNERRQQLTPLVPRLGATLSSAIASTLPFKRDERVQAVTAIVERAHKKLVAADVAIAQLWERLEDELRLGRESGLYSQEITLEGKRHLVEVARVGMVMLLFRTRDGRHGVLTRDARGRFAATVIEDKPSQKQIAALFDAFKKQIRSGFFTLPPSALATPKRGAR